MTAIIAGRRSGARCWHVVVERVVVVVGDSHLGYWERIGPGVGGSIARIGGGRETVEEVGGRIVEL